MKIKKFSDGYMVQYFEDGKFLKQHFVAQGSVDHLDENDNEIDSSVYMPLYHSFDYDVGNDKININSITKYVKDMIKELSSDPVLNLPPSTIYANAPRALVQVTLESKIYLLNELLDFINKQLEKPKETTL